MYKERIRVELKAKVNVDRFESALQVVDSHTVGEFCRIVIGGFPEPQGNTMIEKKKKVKTQEKNNISYIFTQRKGDIQI